MDFLSIDVGTILFTLINTLLIFLAFKFILFKRVDAILEQRQAEVSAVYTAADDAKKAADADKEQYAKLMADAKEETARIISRAEKQAQAKGESIVDDARREAQAVREKADRDIAREMAQAKGELQGEISAIAMELAEKIMEKEISREDHARLIDEFIEGMGEDA